MSPILITTSLKYVGAPWKITNSTCCPTLPIGSMNQLLESFTTSFTVLNLYRVAGSLNKHLNLEQTDPEETKGVGEPPNLPRILCTLC